MKKVVIVSASRTPIGKYLGALSSQSAIDLGATSARATLQRAGVDPAVVEDVILGQVVSAGSGQNPARQAAMRAGVPSSAGALTINRVCGSGLKAVILASQAIRAGDSDVVLAGGMESMSTSPYLLPGARSGYRMGNAQVIDANTHDGLWCSITDEGMGLTGERVARHYGITREEQDAYAFESHRRAVDAQRAGRFDDEIVSIEITSRKGATLVTQDEGPRADSTVEALGKLKPAFANDGTVTAGNAPGLNDGAATLLVTSEERALALGLTPLAEIVASASSGLDPAWVMMTPVPAVRKLLEKTNRGVSDVDLWELNEAFSVQALAVSRDLGLDTANVNVNGGAVALGHPIGASGARILVTLLAALQQRDRETGVATLCMGGGNGLALLVRRLG
ncbi:thiolase family protein [Deinococcus yavapaiensis]|uniref:Acetyl-CoA acetyltransferase n=1 Tax=Deinococcus yavapaiensis KR-236 TaxID=694435 RepID=A0A318SKG1_9DEIO|nr:acetyl-CoA C-acetyltransferase [Deinococcus yavapaiensis]PYE53065.1 acetyl-CoA acetyltransferase [Deinococcus yavapaiensis KR-236]